MKLPLLARVGLRLRITVAFTAAMALLLTMLGAFVYGRFKADLDRSIDQGLRSRAQDVRALVIQSDSGLRQAGGGRLDASGERFAQILSPRGRVLDATPPYGTRALLSPRRLHAALRGPLRIERARAGPPAGGARLLSIPVHAQDSQVVVLVGASLRGHDAALSDLRTILLLGAPFALLIAALLGHLATGLALRSVASMRVRAMQISPADPGRRLPVPPGADELARLAHALNAMLDRNERAFRRERTFIADASHELRSPLAVMRAELDAARIGSATPEELHATVDAAAAEAEHLSVLAENLLTLAEADEARLRLELREIDVARLLGQVAARSAPGADRFSAHVSVHAPEALRAWLDPLRTGRALENLVENALRQGAHHVTLAAARDDADLELSVTDDGPGFPPQLLQRAFERFTRAEPARTSPGTGLGLSIVRSIARAHGGDAYLANDPRGGARVWLRLPGAARWAKSVDEVAGESRAGSS